MNELTYEDAQKQLTLSLDGLNVPVKRKKLTLTNLQWLSRNLSLNNRTDQVKVPHQIIRNLLKKRKEIGL